jgi:hypothetical protein
MVPKETVVKLPLVRSAVVAGPVALLDPSG